MNEGLTPDKWMVTLELFAPNAPEQNPVEDIWLKGKEMLRKSFIENDSFAKIKKSFLDFFEVNKFNFPKLEMYRDFIVQMI